MPKVDLDAIEQTNRTGYPPPFDREVAGRWQKPIGDKVSFAKLGARHATLEPGAWSSQRHWHDGEDELLVMLSGSAVLVEDEPHHVVGRRVGVRRAPGLLLDDRITKGRNGGLEGTQHLPASVEEVRGPCPREGVAS